MKKKKNKVFTFKTTEENLQDFRKRTKSAKANKTTPEEIYLNGLLIEEGKDEEQTVTNKKLMKISLRNKALDDIIKYNALIKAHNLRLKDLNPSRYKNLDPEKDVIKLFDEHGNRIT